MKDLGIYISLEIVGRWKQYKLLFIMNKMGYINKDRITKVTWVITSKHDKRVVCQFTVTIL